MVYETIYYSNVSNVSAGTDGTEATKSTDGTEATKSTDGAEATKSTDGAKAAGTYNSNSGYNASMCYAGTITYAMSGS